MTKQARNKGRYSLLQFLLNFLKYRIRAKNRHAVHSPFVADLIESCFRPNHSIITKGIEEERQKLLSNYNEINVIDYGRDGQTYTRKIKDIAKHSLKPRKYAELIARLADYLHVHNAIELGTSLGITSAYIAKNIQGTLHTFEGSSTILNLAQSVWQNLDIENIKSKAGSFEETIMLNSILNDYFDLLFIDGNHEEKAVLAYFKRLIKYSSHGSVFIIDDIHWSPGMESAWQKIKELPEVTVSIDLYFLGLVFINPAFSRQHYVLKY